MNKLLILVLVILNLILLDMIYNITPLFKYEKYQDLGAIGNIYNKGIQSSKDNNSEINAIVSKYDGTILNINKLSSKTITIPVDNMGKFLSVNDSGLLSYSDNPSNTDSQWELHYITNPSDYNELINNNKGGDLQPEHTKYPFYLVKSKATTETDLALQYNNGKLFVSPLGNYKQQHWDGSTEKIPQIQLKLVDIYDSPVGPLAPNYDNDPNKIKLKLNLNDATIKDLLNKYIGDNEEVQASNEKCDSYLSKDALSSICPGCSI